MYKVMIAICSISLLSAQVIGAMQDTPACDRVECPSKEKKEQPCAPDKTPCEPCASGTVDPFHDDTLTTGQTEVE